MRSKNDGLFGDAYRAQAKSVLSSRFLIPPFSVLNTREGEWQRRKAQWLAVGVRGRNARGGQGKQTLAETYGVGGEKIRSKYKKENARSLHASLALREDKAGLLLRKGFDDVLEFSLSHFDPALCELVYRWFCPPIRAKIFDPFSGSSVSGIVAGEMGHLFTGVDICEEQVLANREQAVKVGVEPTPVWVHGDSAKIYQLLKKNASEFDLLYSCPPYGDLEVYSDNPNDISTMDAAGFDKVYADIVRESCRLLKPGSFAVFLVGDYRDKNGFYSNFPAKTIAAFESAGLRLYNEIILVTAVGSSPLRASAPFVGGRKVQKTHQNLLVFAKGQPKDFVPLWKKDDNI